MKVVGLLVGALAACNGALILGDVAGAFELFYDEHQPAYEKGKEEYFKRMGYFAENLEKIDEMNRAHVLVSGEAVFGITKFSDLTQDEFASMYLNAAMKDTTEADALPRTEMEKASGNDIDWRTKGVLSAIKNQAQCGSCWAFSATEAIESFGRIAGEGGSSILSPQQIVSCDTTDGGCNGGWPYKAFEYVKGAGGMDTEASYPYTSGGGISGSCKVKTQDFVPGLKVTGHVNVARGESNLASALEKGPVSIAVDASSWSSYRGGILSRCGTSVDHAVQAVGMTDSYWVVRNSWGSSWGEEGYIRIQRGSNLCLISDYVSYPTF